MTIFAPKNTAELCEAIKWSVDFEHPLSIRYPKGSVGVDGNVEPIELGKWDVLKKSDGRLVIFAAGALMVEQACLAAQQLEQFGIEAEVVNCRFIKPMDKNYLSKLDGKLVVTLEDNQLAGGFGSGVLEFISDNNIKANVVRMAIDDKVLTQGSVKELLKMSNLDVDSIVKTCKSKLNEFVGK